MNETFCISTTTSAYALDTDTGLGLFPVVDENDNPYYATTTCPASSSATSSVSVVLPDSVGYFFDSVLIFCAVFLWLVVFQWCYNIYKDFTR